MTEPERRIAERLVDSLVRRHGDHLERRTIEGAVRRAWEAFDGAPVRTYLEILVRREADELLLGSMPRSG